MRAGRLPLDRVDARLAPLIAQGMAKDRASRPHSANAFVSELEALAAVTLRLGLGGAGARSARVLRAARPAGRCRAAAGRIPRAVLRRR